MAEDFSAWLARARVPLGFVVSAVYLVFSRPTVRLLAWGALVAALGLGLRALATCYIEKERSLATMGPYAYTRNPLYLGSGIITAGFALAGGVLWLAVLLVACFAGIYWPVIAREERRLSELFPAEFAAYAQAVPLFFPRWRRWREVSAGFRGARYSENREYRALVGYLVALLLLFLKNRFLP